MEKRKETEIEIDGGGMAIILCCIFLVVGIFIGCGISDHGRRRVEKVQAEIRLDMKGLQEDIEKLQLKDELMRIIKAIFQERNQIIDWNRNNIILTVAPVSEAEGN